MMDQQAALSPAGRSPGDDGVSILSLSGELDTEQAKPVRQAFMSLPPASRVVIDLSLVTFIDSAGLGAIIGGIRRTRESGGQVVVAGARTSVSRMLQLTGVDTLARLCDHREAAVAVLTGPR